MCHLVLISYRLCSMSSLEPREYEPREYELRECIPHTSLFLKCNFKAGGYFQEWMLLARS